MPLSDFYGELAAIAGAICFGTSNVIIKSQGAKIKPTAINALVLVIHPSMNSIIPIIRIDSFIVLFSYSNLFKVLELMVFK